MNDNLLFITLTGLGKKKRKKLSHQVHVVKDKYISLLGKNLPSDYQILVKHEFEKNVYMWLNNFVKLKDLNRFFCISLWTTKSKERRPGFCIGYFLKKKQKLVKKKYRTI